MINLQVLNDGFSALHVPYAYGFAIILLTVLVKAATFPLTKKQVCLLLESFLVFGCLCIPYFDKYASLSFQILMIIGGICNVNEILAASSKGYSTTLCWRSGDFHFFTFRMCLL